MKILIISLILLSFFQMLIISKMNTIFDKEIKISREREDLLLQQVKLMDYQIGTLTAEVIK